MPDVTEHELTGPVRHQQQCRAPEQRGGGLRAAQQEAEPAEPVRGPPQHPCRLRDGDQRKTHQDREEGAEQEFGAPDDAHRADPDDRAEPVRP